MASTIEPSSSWVTARTAGVETPACPAMSSINASCSTSCSSDRDGKSSFGPAQQHPAVAAVEEVGVATVLGVHLHEAAAVGRFGAVELGASAFDPRERELTEVEAGSRERARDGSRRGPPVGCTERHEQRRRPRCAPTASARINSGTPRTSGERHRGDKHQQRDVARRDATSAGNQGLPTVVAAAAPAAYASDGKWVDATHVPLVTAPPTRGWRSSTTSSSANAAAPAAPREHEEPETAPALLHGQHDQHGQRQRDRARPG